MKAKKPEQVSLTDFLCSSEIAGSVYFFDLTEFVDELLVFLQNYISNRKLLIKYWQSKYCFSSLM
jgi:hypothetical protein